MTTQKRYLITTADESTWKFDQPILFLGEWCRLYDRRHIWETMNAKVAKPYGLDKSKKEEDFSKIRQLELKLFPEFYEILNKHFNLSHDKRFWQILLGHWFRRILTLLLNRTNTFKQCLQTHNISGVTIFKKNDYLAVFDSTHINTASIDDNWNNLLNARILELLKVDFPIEFLENNNNIPDKVANSKSTLAHNIFNWSIYIYNKISRRFLNDNDAFIINSYLPLKEEIKLELILKQFPQIWRLQNTKNDLSKIIKKPDIHLREKLSAKFLKKSDSDLENIVRSLIFELTPICFLEGFHELKKKAIEQPWPKSPKFIFTSNNFDTHEVFKMWAALKVELGFKYYVGQHGNNYGTKKNYNYATEITTADKFITWGYKKSDKHYPAFIFTQLGQKKNIHNPSGGLLLTQLCHPGSYETFDIESYHIKYFDDQKEFIKSLNSNSKKKLIIRLHKGYQPLRWSEKKRWFDFDPSLKLDIGQTNINNLISRNRLIVHSYDSTGMLETLSQNIPTLAFWQNDFDHLDYSAILNYQSLVDAGIVHLSAKSVANKVNEVWNDVDGWWSQSQIQKARREFCEIYANSSLNSLSKIKRILLS